MEEYTGRIYKIKIGEYYGYHEVYGWKLFKEEELETSDKYIVVAMVNSALSRAQGNLVEINIK